MQINNTTEQNHFIYHCRYSRFVIIQMYNSCAYGLDVKCWARDVNGRTSQIATNCKSEIQTSMHPSICALRTIFVCANLWALRTATRINRTSHWMGGGCCFSEYWFVNNSSCTLNNCLNEHDEDEIIGQRNKIKYKHRQWKSISIVRRVVVSHTKLKTLGVAKILLLHVENRRSYRYFVGKLISQRIFILNFFPSPRIFSSRLLFCRFKQKNVHTPKYGKCELPKYLFSEMFDFPWSSV